MSLNSLFVIPDRSLGFSMGDELGFPESLGNVEGGNKRSLDTKTGRNVIGVLPADQMPVRFSFSLRSRIIRDDREVVNAHGAHYDTR